MFRTKLKPVVLLSSLVLLCTTAYLWCEQSVDRVAEIQPQDAVSQAGASASSVQLMIEVTFLIPVADNDGVTFSDAHHTAFEQQASVLFGGFTRLPTNATGGWVDPATGRLYSDTSRLYVVFVPSITAGGKVAELAAWAKAHYRQHTIAIRYLGFAEIL